MFVLRVTVTKIGSERFSRLQETANITELTLFNFNRLLSLAFVFKTCCNIFHDSNDQSVVNYLKKMEERLKFCENDFQNEADDEKIDVSPSPDYLKVQMFS